MTTQHTPEPWLIEKDLGKLGTNTLVVNASNEDMIADCGCLNGLSRQQSENNAVRIVACVNACAGLNPEGIGETVQALENALNVLAGLATFDLRRIDKDSPAIKQARSALAKVKGNQ